MSSAILYLAIVAIWACVLIPRWLRRDSSASTVTAETEDEAVVDSAADVEQEPEPSVSPPRRRRSDASPEPRSVPVADEDPADRGRRRALSARRRLLLMLLALTAAAGALAGTRMAAWWVVVPPAVMLLGYLLLLRAAAKADAERREMAQYRMARAAAEEARAPVRHAAPARRVAAGRSAVPASPAASAASASRASRAAASVQAAQAKIITIPAASDEGEIYDQYADAKLRAVGD